MANIIDLIRATQSDAHASCDICVIGAGAAGLYLASRLSRDRMSVIVLEAGGATCESGGTIGIEPLFSDSKYCGATEGRAFGWGGSTSRWGGLLVPHSELDLRDEPSQQSVAWQHIVNVVRERSSAVFSGLGLWGHPEFFSSPEAALGTNAKVLHECGLETVAAEFLPFRRRNLTYLVSGQAGSRLTVYLNAVASTWSVKPTTTGAGTVVSVEASSQLGKKLRVSAKSFVIAAGAIESARILLEIDRSTQERLLSRSALIGRCLSDHLSCVIADVHSDDRNQAIRMFGPVFAKGRMRSFRFIEPSAAPSVPRHFAHFLFDIDNAGFRLAKNVLSSLQSKTLPDVRLWNVIDGMHGLARLAYDRFVKSSLFIPAHTSVRLQLDIEQVPHVENRVHLGEELDRFGRPVAVVHWRVNEMDHENIRLLSRQLLMRWPGPSLGFPRLSPFTTGGTSPKPYDAYHPVGTCRMGADSEATVDLELRVRGTHNLFVLSTAVFPSAGTANPTFSMLCLGDLLADRLAKPESESSVVSSTVAGTTSARAD